MSMLEEIKNYLFDTDTSFSYRIINLGGQKLYVEGIKSIVGFGEDEMQFQLNKKLLKVKGHNLQIKYLDKTTCTLSGDITSTEIE